MLALASYYPLPTMSTPYYGAPNASLAVNVQDRADQGIFKVDHEATKWLKLSATYIHYGSTEPSNTFFPNPGTPNQTIYDRHVDGLSSNAVATLNPEHGTDGAVRPEPVPGFRSEFQQRLSV